MYSSARVCWLFIFKVTEPNSMLQDGKPQEDGAQMPTAASDNEQRIAENEQRLAASLVRCSSGLKKC